MGGALAALDRGFQQDEIADAAYAFQRRVEEGMAKVVGVNCHQVEDEAVPEPLFLDPAGEARQVERLRELRSARDSGRVAATRDALRRKAATAENLLPPILDCVRAETTLGEIADTLRGVFGEHTESGSSR